jgi:hypothetical protein
MTNRNQTNHGKEIANNMMDRQRHIVCRGAGRTPCRTGQNGFRHYLSRLRARMTPAWVAMIQRPLAPRQRRQRW